MSMPMPVYHAQVEALLSVRKAERVRYHDQFNAMKVSG